MADRPKKTPATAPDAFRAELKKIMPGYSWTVHKTRHLDRCLVATGTQSSGFNRLSTLVVTKMIGADGAAIYKAQSAGNGVKSPWVHSNTDGTLARSLRGLQDSYEREAVKFRALAAALQRGRETEKAFNV